ncbi:hypothetical protein [Streptomyces sp. B1I3]|uniref:hypothetical protein n=1 Tax=Streptomyces sp. B1I3 TaxID=3042264 RepID=UPI002781707C|nr:hypothetical protein [Streptomyces sp. B1I3]MDQ0796738.1 hypothetical protein [Streptomyces sp. B1I3]
MPPLRAVPSSAGHPYAEQAGAERAEAALTEHYARLVRIGYLILPPTLGRNRRVLTAHWLVQRSLPRARPTNPEAAPAPASEIPRAPDVPADAGRAYACVRLRVVRAALEAGLPLRRFALPRRVQLPPLLPQVWGLRLFPHSCGADELALEQALAGVSGPCRAAHVLRGLEGLDDPEVCRVLGVAGVSEPEAALREADALPARHALLASPEFDACSLQVRPTDPARRRRFGRALVAGLAALLVCGTLLLMPDDGLRGPQAASPLHSRHRAAEQAVDPSALHRVAAGFWRSSARTDFTAWPTRGHRAGDSRLLGRALAAWARPGPGVASSATPGTPAGPPMGPPQLLYAGEVGPVVVVLFHDGLRIVRYAEPRDAGPAGGVALDFARVDGADAVAASALVVQRRGGRIRYLTAPWVREVAVRDLLVPREAARPLHRDPDGVTDALTGPGGPAGCHSWQVLEVRDATGVRLLTDLGELTPVRLTSGTPSAPHDVAGPAERESWARTACLLPAVRSNGVRSVNSWPYARQRLPEGEGAALWLCTRAETWRGTGSRALAQFQPPGGPGGTRAPGTVAAHAQDSPDCGVRRPRVLAGVLWRSAGGRWYVLAAGSRQFASLSATGGVRGRTEGRLLAVRARAGDRARLDGLLADGSRVRALR